jgi:SET domain-containing protein
MKRFYPEDLPTFRYEPTQDDFEIRSINDHIGQGVISKKSFRKGTLVCAFTGFLSETITQYTLQINKRLHIHDPYFMGKILHSCDPNTVCDVKKRIFIALRDIYPGEPITIDYAHTEVILYKPFYCTCGAKNCRGYVTGSMKEKAYKKKPLLRKSNLVLVYEK